MRNSLILASLLPALGLGGCAMFGGGSTVDPAQLAPRRNAPLVIPSTFTLPPPAQPAASAQAR
jgi:hypothetical protein